MASRGVAKLRAYLPDRNDIETHFEHLGETYICSEVVVVAKCCRT